MAVTIEAVACRTAADTPPIVTVAPKRCEPVIVKTSPSMALAGSTKSITGAATFRKVNGGLVAVPPGVLTVTTPEIDSGTITVIEVSVMMTPTPVRSASTPEKLTLEVVDKFVPTIFTTSPAVTSVIGLSCKSVTEETVGAAGRTVYPATVEPEAVVTRIK